MKFFKNLSRKTWKIIIASSVAVVVLLTAAITLPVV